MPSAASGRILIGAARSRGAAPRVAPARSTPPQASGSAGIGAARRRGVRAAPAAQRATPTRRRCPRATSRVATCAMQSGARAPALAAAPGAELGVEVVARQAEQAGDEGRAAGHRRAVAVVAGGQAARRIAAPHQRLAGVAQRRPIGRRQRRRIRQVEAGEVGGDLAQVGVVEQLEQAVHQRVVAPLVAEIAQLVEQIAGGLAGDARVVAVGRGAAFAAVAAACRRARAGRSCPRTASVPKGRRCRVAAAVERAAGRCRGGRTGR